ncbi:S9 family peptidase [Candidatus Paraluminiphilus aquimaris]|uniref:prolyl oligopeptidase n=1 Tax=Candidatus Paraluminiphilus aquimaris TaxID=2518994 RepID=A0ABY6Q7X5_9GAMM|nr:prolyl oligopeptidase family serine peptidase [Candidatus Paraluminiphilus aquimaris]UZP75174.1 S9 family peptidase [Candidatus Paraluminiphilus aquimaris]
MKKTTLCLVALSGLLGCGDNTSSDAQIAASAPINTVDTRRGNHVDTYFGVEVADPYRWLEDDLSDETSNWIGDQNSVTRDYLADIAIRDDVKATVARLINYEREGAPFVAGDARYVYRNSGLQNQSILYRVADDGSETVFLDPNSFSDDGTVSMSGVSFTDDGSRVAYQLSVGGSDWRSIVVRDVASGQILETPLNDVKFSGISWLGSEGFFYSSYDKPEGSELSAKTDQHKLYFHRIGTAQSQDELVFGELAEQKHRYVGADVGGDDRYLLISAANSTSGNKLFVKDLRSDTNELITLFADERADGYLLESDGETLLISTNHNAPKGRVVAVDPQNPKETNWRDIIPESEVVLTARAGAGFIFAEYMIDAISQVKQFDLKGQFVRDIELPDFGTASGFSGKKEQDTIYFSFTNYRIAPAIFELDPESGDTTLYRASKSPFDGNRYKTEQVFYTSKDGTRIPMIITYGKDTELDGTTPTILYAYGGFNISIRPRFSSTVAAWLEMGGIYAVPNIRGGGEYGKAWHIAGTKRQKQNVFDDFIAAAEFLIEAGYTRKERLAVSGRSNGGLLVGAVTTQRPDLFQVSLPGVGVLDMLRYHTFTAGAGWAYDYGTADESKEMFEYLLGYSPVHNTTPGTAYPATLITTAERDDRVVPAHSFKFAAQMQYDHVGDTPILIRIDSNAGHGAGTPTDKIIDQYTDIYSFTLKNMGVEKVKTSGSAL